MLNRLKRGRTAMLVIGGAGLAAIVAGATVAGGQSGQPRTTWADYGGGAKYSIFEHSVACAQWIRDEWSKAQRQAASERAG